MADLTQYSLAQAERGRGSCVVLAVLCFENGAEACAGLLEGSFLGIPLWHSCSWVYWPRVWTAWLFSAVLQACFVLAGYFR